jgi:hypothetical protein
MALSGQNLPGRPIDAGHQTEMRCTCFLESPRNIGTAASWLSIRA